MTQDQFNAALDSERVIVKTSRGWFLARRESQTYVFENGAFFARFIASQRSRGIVGFSPDPEFVGFSEFRILEGAA